MTPEDEIPDPHIPGTDPVALIPTPTYRTDTKGRTRMWCTDCHRYVILRPWPLLSLHRCSMAFREDEP